MIPNIVSGVSNAVPSLSRYYPINDYRSSFDSRTNLEAKKVNQYWSAMDKISGAEPSITIAEARAGQILAEMLGMVCHPEYITSGTSQTVHPPSFPLCIPPFVSF